MSASDSLLATLENYPRLLVAAQLLGLVVVVWLATLFTRLIIVRGVTRSIGADPSPWGAALLGRGVISRLAHVVPALLVYYGIGLIPALPDALVAVVRSVASAYVVLTIALSITNLLKAAGDAYEQRDPARARARPIKGYLEVARIVILLVATILVIATLFDRDPLLLFSGLGAMTAVLLLVFKDTILSLVASVQLTTNDMLRVGDWIEMPQLNADGDVIDMSLHTVKVQNWDKTITTIPTWRLINESYKNWRGMVDSGGRRIKRAIHLDQSSVRFLGDAERDRLRRIALIDPYLERKQSELEAINAALLASNKDPVNTRRVTNLGTFRAYVTAYLRAHPRVHRNLTQMVRQLAPGPTGVPLEIYCFTDTTAWVEYEGIQADIFDHLFAILPEFGLRVFQQPSGSDLLEGLGAVRVTAGDN